MGLTGPPAKRVKPASTSRSGTAVAPESGHLLPRSSVAVPPGRARPVNGVRNLTYISQKLSNWDSSCANMPALSPGENDEARAAQRQWTVRPRSAWAGAAYVPEALEGLRQRVAASLHRRGAGRSRLGARPLTAGRCCVAVPLADLVSRRPPGQRSVPGGPMEVDGWNAATGREPAPCRGDACSPHFALERGGPYLWRGGRSVVLIPWRATRTRNGL